MSYVLKCKFCKWQILRWITKKEKRINQSDKLIAHVMMKHPTEYWEAQDKLLEERELV